MTADGRTAINNHVPTVRQSGHRNDANRCMPVYIRLHEMRAANEAQEGRLLRLLFLWRRGVSADPRGTCGMLQRLRLPFTAEPLTTVFSYKSIFQKHRRLFTSTAPKSCSPYGSLSAVKSANIRTASRILPCTSASSESIPSVLKIRPPLKVRRSPSLSAAILALFDFPSSYAHAAAERFRMAQREQEELRSVCHVRVGRGRVVRSRLD